jgi:GNAT superfamily N-acetyltransferase
VDTIVVRAEPFGSPVAQQLAAAANAVNIARYGSPDKTPIRVEEFDPARGGGFLVCYFDDRPVGCVGFRRAEEPAPAGTAELKRMYVDESLRRRGLGRRLLAALEDAAREQGYTRLILDTGAQQPEAIALYEYAGFKPIPSYSIYRDSPHNRAFGKALTSPDQRVS